MLVCARPYFRCFIALGLGHPGSSTLTICSWESYLILSASFVNQTEDNSSQFEITV